MMPLKNLKNITQDDMIKMFFTSTKKITIPELNLEIQYRDNIPNKPGRYLIIFAKLPEEKKEEEKVNDGS